MYIRYVAIILTLLYYKNLVTGRTPSIVVIHEKANWSYVQILLYGAAQMPPTNLI